MFRCFFNSLARSRYLSFFSFSFNFTLWSTGTAKSIIQQVLFSCRLLLNLVEIRWSVCITKSQRSLCVSFSRTDSWFCIYHLFVWSNLNFLHNSQWITLSTPSCLVLYYFCACLLHSLIMWLIVSSLSPHNKHLLFCCILSILALIWLVLMALFCAAISTNTISLLRFHFFSLVHVFSFEIFCFLVA